MPSGLDCEACASQGPLSACSRGTYFQDSDLAADDAYDDGAYDPAEHSPTYNVDMDPGDRTAVFDLALDDDSDDGGGLLDWNILAGILTPNAHHHGLHNRGGHAGEM